MKDLKRKIHYWCSDTMQNKSLERRRLCRSGYRYHTAPGSCRPHRGMEGLRTGEENHI